MNFTSDQKKQVIQLLLTAAVMLILGIAAAFGYDVTVIQPRPVAPSMGGAVGAQAAYPIQFTNAGTKMKFLTGSTFEVQAGATETHAGTTTWTSVFNADAGIAVDTTNFTVNGTTGAVATASSLTANSAAIGGGYSSTGCDISSAGALQCSGASTIDNLNTTNMTATAGSLTSVTVGGGYGATGCTISAAGVLQCDGAATYGSTINSTGGITTNAALTGATAEIGGGYASTGCSISSAGALQCSGASTIDNLNTTNITATNVYGTVGTPAQTSITSVGTLTGLTVNGLVNLAPSSVITVTDGAAFAIAGGMNTLAAAGEVTPTITIPAAGTYACLYNSSAQTIHIADSGNQVLSAQWDAGQYDTICLWSDGTRVIKLTSSDN